MHCSLNLPCLQLPWDHDLELCASSNVQSQLELILSLFTCRPPQPRLNMHREELNRLAGSSSNLQPLPPDLPQLQQAGAQQPPQQHPPPDLPQLQQAGRELPR